MSDMVLVHVSEIYEKLKHIVNDNEYKFILMLKNMGAELDDDGNVKIYHMHDGIYVKIPIKGEHDDKET